MKNNKYKIIEKIKDSEIDEYISDCQYFFWDYDDWAKAEPEEEIIEYSYEEIEQEPSDKYLVSRSYRWKIPTGIIKMNEYKNIRKVDMMSIYPIDVLRNKKIDIILSED
jgi:hypothetical protein